MHSEMNCYYYYYYFSPLLQHHLLLWLLLRLSMMMIKMLNLIKVELHVFEENEQCRFRLLVVAECWEKQVNSARKHW
jgi:hypothetical protein